MMTALYIGIAGGLGSVSRYWLGTWVSRQWGDKFAMPLGTLAVNVLGSLLIGILVGLVVTRGDLDARTRLVLGVGFLGGFTTYSSFAVETVDFIQKRTPALAASYIAVTLACAGFACFVGLAIGKRF